MQVLYIDVLLASNLAMNYLSFGITARLTHRPLRLPRRLASSLLGALYAVLAVLLAFPLVLHIPVLVFLSFLLLRIAFGKMGSGKLLFGAFCAFCLSNFLLGGAAEWLFGYMEQAFGTRTYFGLRSSDVALLAGFGAYLVLKLVLRFFSDTPVSGGASVRFVLGNRSLTLPLLVDSGCLL
ncbi:MAG: sigma-E processing peptidase SpoIIGA, partial [Clostridia bacterium]|nr:sigma-E processing peptidase SpoIIGA [Clostridia bacterium]